MEKMYKNNPKNIRKAGIAYVLAATTVITGITSCVKDNFDLDKLTSTEYSPNLAVPLVYSSLSIADLLKNSEDASNLIQVDNTSFCTLVYRSNLISLTADELIQIPNNTAPPINAALSSSQISAFGINGTIVVPFTQSVNFDTGTNGPKIDSALFKAGKIGISLSSTFQYSGQIKITIPAAVKNGVVFQEVVPFTYSGSTPVVSIDSFDLAGYKFNMTNGGITFNQFAVDAEVTLSGTGNPITTGDQVTINMSLNNLKFSRIYGDIGQMAVAPGLDTVDISLFKNVLGSANFSLVDPRIKVIITNSYGVPIQASLSQFDAYTPGGSLYAITGFPNPLPVQSPSFSQIGWALADSFQLDNSNSNIATVINNTPKYLIYNLNTLTNPSGGTTHNNFVLDTSRLNLDLEVNLPLWGKASNFVLQDTVPFELGNTLPEQVESAKIRAFNSNGFPFDVDMQIYFADSLYNVLDSLVSPPQLILASALVNSSTGMVTAPTTKTYDATLTKARLDYLTANNAKYLLVKAKAATANSGATNVKIYSYYKLDFKLGLQVQVRTKF